MAAPLTERLLPELEPADPATESAIAGDLVKRALLIAPIALGVAAVLRGGEGAASAAFALAVVAANFALAAASLSWAARISTGLYLGTALGGYVVRLVIITGVVIAVRNVNWIDLPTLGITLISAHLGLLTWELRHVSLSFAAPGLKPARPGPLGAQRPTRQPSEHAQGAAQ